MAWNEDAVAVLRAERARGARRTRAACESGELAIRHDLAARDGAERESKLPPERRQLVEVELDVAELDVLACEERPQPGDESWREIGTVARVLFG
jgi:hypothetical protein